METWEWIKGDEITSSNNEAVKELNKLYDEKTADNKEKWSQLQHITVSLSQYHLIASDTEPYIP